MKEEGTVTRRGFGCGGVSSSTTVFFSSLARGVTMFRPSYNMSEQPYASYMAGSCQLESVLMRCFGADDAYCPIRMLGALANGLPFRFEN